MKQKILDFLWKHRYFLKIIIVSLTYLLFFTVLAFLSIELFIIL